MSPDMGTISSGGNEGGRRKVGERVVSKTERVRCVLGVCVSSSKRRSYGSWLSGRRGELLKTNSLQNSGRDAALEAIFL